MVIDMVEHVSYEICEKEPLANSGFIQANGALLFIEKSTGFFKYASENILDWIGEEIDDLLGIDGTEWLEMNIPDLPALPTTSGKRVQLSNALDMGMGELDVQISATSQGWIIEFEKSHDSSVIESVDLIKPSGTVDKAFISEVQQSLVEAIAKVSGYDRVMLYKFGADWSGEVLAETVTIQSGEYLGLRFPATDIPSIARSLYAKLPYRHIPDARLAPVQIMGFNNKGESLDITWSDLRSVSPFHITYLNNMNVRSSFSVSIMVEGKLWGLIACHHHDALEIPLVARIRCKELVDEYVDSLLAYRHSVQSELFDRVMKIFKPLEKNVERGSSQILTDQLDELCTLTESQACALIIDGSVVNSSETVEHKGVLPLHEWCMHKTTGDVVSIDDLPSKMGERAPKDVCGVMALNFRAKQFNNAAAALYFLRPEETSEIAWAGNQDQLIEAAASGQLSPRSSFEKWVEVRHGLSRPWDEDVCFTGAQIREKLAVIL